MSNKFRQPQEITIGTLYAAFVLAIGAYFNYVTPYDSNPTIVPSMIELLLWVLLYLPLGLMVMVAKWDVADFGFSITTNLSLAILFIVPVCSSITWGIQSSWLSAIIESFARTGEEIFFRGFLFALLLKVFAAKKKPWIWAVLISSVLFTFVHAQTFQPDFFANRAESRAYVVIERLFNLLLIAVFLALLRHWTQSILPSAIIHGTLASGIITIPFCFLIYAIIVFIAYLRKEKVLLFIKPGSL
jgi:membrane protease YdiL (CAAX protease family)